MKKKTLSRRDFLKLAGLGTAVIVPGALGYGVFQSAQGTLPVENSPYARMILQKPVELDGSIPILLLINSRSENPFGHYLGEILRAEGLNCYHLADIGEVQSWMLEKYDIVLLSEGPVEVSQAEMLEKYVFQGGRLIAMRPDERLLGLFGVEKIDGSIFNGYIKTELEHPACMGISRLTLQFHDVADLYNTVGSQTVAWLYHDRETDSYYPAITVNHYGEGLASLWAFDLVKSVVYMRQGNPELVGQEMDGHPFIRASDMFVNWIDLDRIQVPQADEQQRLLVNLVNELTKDLTPIPRLWHFPGTVNALLVATGDAHPMSNTTAIDYVLRRVENYGGHMSIYRSFSLHDDLYRFAQRGRFYASSLPGVGDILDRRFSNPTPRHIAEWRSRGHEFTVHPHVGEDMCGGNTDTGNISFNSLEEGWETYWREFTGLGYGDISPTVRTHCVLWKGWTETARLQASYGIRMNLDYYHVGPAFRKKSGEWVYGHFTGSGLPMKFIDAEGRILEIYQQLTQLADEHFFSFPEMDWVSAADYAPEEAIKITQGLMDFSLENQIPSAFCVNFHTDQFAFGGRPFEVADRWLDGTLSHAAKSGIPIWSAMDWWRFTSVRHDAVISSMVWDEDGNVVEFVVETESVDLGAQTELALMLPFGHGNNQLVDVSIDDVTAHTEERRVGNILYRWFSIAPGKHRVTAQYAPRL